MLYINCSHRWVDKRKAHLSCLVLGGELSRQQAVVELDSLPIDAVMAQSDSQFVAKKLNVSIDELMALCGEPGKSFTDYRNSFFLNQRLGGLAQGLRRRGIDPA